MDFLKKSSRGDGLFYLINGSLLAFALVVVLYPLIYILSASFSSTSAVITGQVWLWPVDFSLSGYKAVFENRHILTGYGNTIFYTIFGTIFNLVLTIAAAYPLSRKDFKGRNIYMMIFVFTMFFNGGLIPTYILMTKLGLVNTRYVMILAGALSVYNMIITRTFFQATIGKELYDAAKIDGASDIKILFKIVLPLSKAIIAVITLFYMVHHWNQFFNAFIYLNDKKLFPLQLILREILIANQIDVSMMENIELEELEAKEGLAELLKYSLIIVSSAPVLMIYPFVQKYFVKGVMIGSVKG